MKENPAVYSVQQSINAYQRCGSPCARLRFLGSSNLPPSLANSGPLTGRSGVRIREMKVSVISSLHERSNSGMVNLSDVAIALDHLLKP